MKFVLLDIGKALRWSITLGNKLLRVVPGYTAVGVVSSILSQFFLLAGFLLPLKVVLLLGSDTVPGYFPLFLREVGRDGLVVMLSIAAVGFYLTHLLMSKLVDISGAAGSRRLLVKSKKMAIFENQQDIASKGYQRYTQSLATVCFVAICLAGMAAFYPKIALVIIGYIVTCVVIVAAMISLFEAFQNRVNENLGATAKLLGGIGFLVSFGFIVLDHLMGRAPGLLVSVISLLLARQLFGRAANLVKDLQGLYGQKAQLAALFFHGHVFHRKPKGRDRGVWGLVEPKTRDSWLSELLRSTEGQLISQYEAVWLDIGVPDVLCYQVTFCGEEGNKALLIKLFNSNRSAWAKHEATLITSQPQLPMVPLVTVTDVEGLHCHIFDISGLFRCGKAETAKKLPDFRARLSLCVPDGALAAAYLRSHPQIWQRLDKELLFRVQYLLGPEADKLVLDRFRDVMPGIQDTLRTLPLSIHAPDIRPSMLWKDQEENFALGHWVRWDLEPLGSRWPFAESAAERLLQLLQEAQSKRPDAREVTLPQVRLSALFAEFETRLQRGRYAEAYSLISPMLSEYDAL